MYRIGKLAKEAGISIRTLRYYDQLGVLTPSIVSDAGYRYYDKEDVMKLHHITTLKQLGFTLTKIKSLLQEDKNDLSQTDRWKHAIQLQIQAVREEQERLALLDRMLHTTLHTIEIRSDVKTEELLRFIQLLQSDNASSENEEQRQAHRRNKFTPEELEVIESLPMLHTDDARTTKWVHLLRDIHMHKGGPPDTEVAMQLAARVLEITEEAFHGQYDVVEKYWEWVRPEPGSEEKVLGLDEYTMAYIDRILDEYLRREERECSNE